MTGAHVVHTLVRFTLGGVEHISCTSCPLTVPRPAGVPDYRRATMSTWNRGNQP